MSYKNILNQALTIRLMELYKENDQEKSLDILSNEICETLNCEPISFIKENNSILERLEKINRTIGVITFKNKCEKEIVTKEIDKVISDMKDTVIKDIAND